MGRDRRHHRRPGPVTLRCPISLISVQNRQRERRGGEKLTVSASKKVEKIPWKKVSLSPRGGASPVSPSTARPCLCYAASVISGGRSPAAEGLWRRGLKRRNGSVPSAAQGGHGLGGVGGYDQGDHAAVLQHFAVFQLEHLSGLIIPVLQDPFLPVFLHGLFD